MSITRQMIADKIAAYLHHQLLLRDLVDWAERLIMDADFDSTEARDAAARIGLADVRAFGLTWEDCESLLGSLGYKADIRVVFA